MNWYFYKPYVSAAQRRANGAREVAKLKKKGKAITPIVLEGRKLTTTFWGQAWCDNLEAYSDFASRLPRGRTYVRNGSVVHLEIEPLKVTALVSGSELYEVSINIGKLPANSWQAVKKQCAGQIGSLVELLQGRLSDRVMEIVTHRQAGLFPKPAEIKMDCSCPDWAGMCKHIAAVMYGIGARLDQQPELLFQLRQLDHLELISEAGTTVPGRNSRKGRGRTIASSELSGVFGIELAGSEARTPGEAMRDPSPAEPTLADQPSRKAAASGNRKLAKPRTKRVDRPKTNSRNAVTAPPDLVAPSGSRSRNGGGKKASAVRSGAPKKKPRRQ